MERETVERLNELSRTARERPLTDAEQAERASLRQKYLAACRESLRGQLENIEVVQPDGSRRPLAKKPRR